MGSCLAKSPQQKKKKLNLSNILETTQSNQYKTPTCSVKKLQPINKAPTCMTKSKFLSNRANKINSLYVPNGFGQDHVARANEIIESRELQHACKKYFFQQAMKNEPPEEYTNHKSYGRNNSI